MEKDFIPYVSVVIPVYNAEMYLKKCIDSLRYQTFADFELLLINDGSKDSSSEICHSYEKRDSRIHTIDKENGGVSSARNLGLNICKGQYILFVDADDYLENTMLEHLFQSAMKHQADLVFCGYEVVGSKLIFNDTDVLKDISNSDGSVEKNKVFKAIVSISKDRVYGYIWRNLFRVENLKKNEIFFSVGIKISEDFMFLLDVLNSANRISIVPKSLYNYRINEFSATAKYMPSLLSDMTQINQWMLQKICINYPDTICGYKCCVANTYLRAVQNFCRKGTPYGLIERIKKAYQVKKENGYENALVKALFSDEKLTMKNRFSYAAFILYLEFIYILLFSAKINIKN